MSLNKIQFEICLGNCTLNELVTIHEACDFDFDPPLSSRVEIKEYCQKLFENANLITAKLNAQLVGVLAIYCNNFKNRLAYISSICVMPNYRGFKLGNDLLFESLDVAKKNGMARIRLEVGKSNYSAIALYEKFNFYIIEERIDVFLMELRLS